MQASTTIPSLARAGAAAALLSGLLASTGAQASEVSFTGGFTSFSGPVATAPGALSASVHTWINDETVYADAPLPGVLPSAFTSLGLGQKNTTSLLQGGQPIAEVKFQRTFFDVPIANYIGFEPSAPIEIARPGEIFTVGTFRATNGNWFGNAAGETLFPDTDFGFTVTTHSADPLLDGKTYSGLLRFHVTNPVGPSATFYDDADSFYFVKYESLGTFSVFERLDLQGGGPLPSTGYADFKVKIGSLIPVAFDNPSGGAFIGPPVSVVPEAGSATLFAIGLGAIAVRLRRCSIGRRDRDA